jgi:tRNA(Ile)-lysidine synthase
LLPFEAAVASNLGTWAEGTVFLAAVSGGADSTAMLAALAVIAQQRGYAIQCLHVDHGIRSPEERRGDVKSVKSFCTSLDVSCRIVSIPAGKVAETAKTSGLGIEGAARLFRRRAWNREARRIGAARILVAHTRDDLLETVLMRILRGSGPAGLGTMPRERGLILRPLLSLNRSDALAYLKARNIPFRTDSTNEDIRYLRNRIRHKLVSCLDDQFPYWRKTVFSMAETQKLTAEFLDSEARRQVSWEEARNLYTPAAHFFSLSQIIQEEALFHATDRLARIKKNASAFEPDTPESKKRRGATPRRETIRRFRAAGSVDAGPIRIENRNGKVVVAPYSGKTYDTGYTLLIKEPGTYTLKGLKIVCRFSFEREKPKVLLPGMSVKTGEPGGASFFAYLPLVFRRSHRSMRGLDKIGYSEYTDTITVEDRNGPIAYIFSDIKDTMIVLCREVKRAGEDPPLSCVIVSGGIDV